MKIPSSLAHGLLVVPWLLAAGIFGWILVNRFPPNGTFVATSVMDGKHPFINPFLPSERTTVPGAQPDGWIGQRITGDPTYFTSRTPGPYERADVEVEFRSIRQPLIELGIVRDAEGKNLDLVPMYSSELQPDEWVATGKGFVKKGIPYARLSNPKPEGLVVWDASNTMPLLQDDAQDVRETKTSLRGAHDFYLVPAGGAIDVTFGLQDVNRKRGNTIAVFRILRGDQELRSEVLETSGSRDASMGKVIERRIAVKDAAPGVYRISFQADDDVFVRSIRTTSRRWVIGPRLNFGDIVGYEPGTFPGHAWTTSRHIVADTFHREGLQTVTLGTQSVKVVRTHESFRLDRADEIVKPVELRAPNGDIRFIGDGWFSLQPDAFFEPKPKRMTDGTELKREGVEGVVTPYRKPERLDGEWMKASFTFSLDPTLDRLRFVLSAPGVASRLGAVDVRKITIRYRRPAVSFVGWWDILVQEAKNAWRRL